MTGFTVTDEMVESAARGMFAEEQCDKRQRENLEENWNSRLNDEDQAEYRALARAALEAAAVVQAAQQQSAPVLDRGAAIRSAAQAMVTHYPTRGISVTSGETCECGYWTGSEEPSQRVGLNGRDRLNWHRAHLATDAILALTPATLDRQSVRDVFLTGWNAALCNGGCTPGWEIGQEADKAADAILALVPPPVCNGLDGRDHHDGPAEHCPVHGSPCKPLTATREKLTEALAAADIRWNVRTAAWERAGYLEAQKAADALLASGVVQEASAQPSPVVDENELTLVLAEKLAEIGWENVSEPIRSQVVTKWATALSAAVITAGVTRPENDCAHAWEEINPGNWMCKELCGADVDLTRSPDWRPENEVRADELTKTADEFGVDISGNDAEWHKGYRQAQREIIHRLSERAAAIRAGEQS